MGTTPDEDEGSPYGIHRVKVQVIGGLTPDEFTKLSEPTPHPYFLTGNLLPSGRTLEDMWILRYLQVLNSALNYKNKNAFIETKKLEWTKIKNTKNDKKN